MGSAVPCLMVFIPICERALPRADKGVTWSNVIVVNRLLSDEVTDPDDGHDVRTGDILPDWAVDRSSNAATRGQPLRGLDGHALQRRRPQRHPAGPLARRAT
jgi:hypothetical protein